LTGKREKGIFEGEDFYMPKIKLQVIEKPPEGATVLKQQSFFGPIVAGQDTTENAVDYLCGKCEIVLAKNVRKNQLQNIVLYCNRCGAYNYIP
jgi:hypothetical protein